MKGLLPYWRHAAIAGAAAGLLASPWVASPPAWLPCLIVAGVALAALARRVPAVPERQGGAAAALLTASLLGLGVLAGLGLGSLRLAAIDAGAFQGPRGEKVVAKGFVAAVPRSGDGELRFPLETTDGRVVVVAAGWPEDLGIGDRVQAKGTLAPPEEFRAAELARLGAALELRGATVESIPGERGGLTGALDRIRERAELALSAGMDDGQSALARGFVLGQDDLIDPLVRDDFKRSGLAHLLAVSGQNVMLLAILAGVLLGIFGVPLRLRLVLILALIAAYVPVAGAGPSIERAAVMGAAGIVATLAGRPADRSYAILLAAAATLLINPRFGSDVGWQLSFAAVLGIVLWAGRIRVLMLPGLGRRMPDPLARPLAEGAALTIAATIATAPLMAHHFEQLSVASLPANLAVLVLVAPVMWLGMLLGLLGQLPLVPTAPLAAVEGWLVDLIAAIAHAFAAPAWAQAELPLPGGGALLVVYLAIAAALSVAIALLQRRRGLAIGSTPRAAVAVVAGIAGAVALVGGLGAAVSILGSSSVGPVPAGALRVTEIDVGQGDATLLQLARGDPILVDAGPPGGGVVDGLRNAGVERLEAVFVTHDELDHAGGIYDVLDAFAVSRLVHGLPAPRLETAAERAGAKVTATAQGGSFRFGRLHLDVLWPPADADPAPGSNLNDYALVIAARSGPYTAMLMADAESEVTHIAPGPFDLLKLAHHGSDDAGLEAMLETSAPRAALIGVGADNTYGHPTPATIAALEAHGVCVLRTDLDSDVSVELGPDGISIASPDDPAGERSGCPSDA